MRIVIFCPFVIDHISTDCCFVLVVIVPSGYHISGDKDKRIEMAVHGTLVAFNPREEDWTEYAERLSFYFAANGNTNDAKKCTILLSCVGPTTFRLMKFNPSCFAGLPFL